VFGEEREAKSIDYYCRGAVAAVEKKQQMNISIGGEKEGMKQIKGILHRSDKRLQTKRKNEVLVRTGNRIRKKIKGKKTCSLSRDMRTGTNSDEITKIEGGKKWRFIFVAQEHFASAQTSV